MLESPSNPNETPNTAKPRMVRLDAAAIIASLIGLFALVVGGYTAYIQREQVRAQVWPFLLEADSSNSSEYIWLNKGVGPALVESLQVFVDGKSQHDWNGVLHALQLGTVDYDQSTLNRYVLSAGETVVWIKFKDPTVFKRFFAAQQTRVDFKVCYCSTLGECWIDDTEKGMGGDRTAVGECPAVSKSQQFDN